MSTRTIELVTFENDSVLNQKSISLPIGKVSIRQTAILFSGILVTFLVFMTMDNLVVSGLVFTVFLGIGLIGTRVMTADQMIKSHLRMLIRGTSLEQKPEYMENPKKKQQQQQQTDNEKSNLNQNEQQKNNNELVNQVLSQIKSLYKKKDNTTANTKKESKSLDNKVENNEKFSASIELTDQNIIHVTSKNNDVIKPLLSTEKKNNDPIENMIRKLSKKEKPESDSIKDHITVSLDGKSINESNRMIIKSKESLSLELENNQRYVITITADNETPEILQD